MVFVSRAMGVAKVSTNPFLSSDGKQQSQAEEMEAGSINVLITGTNRGLGLEMVKQMVEGSIPVKKLIVCCRDPDGPRAEVSAQLLSLSDSSPRLQCCFLWHSTRSLITFWTIQNQAISSSNHVLFFIGPANTGKGAS